MNHCLDGLQGILPGWIKEIIKKESSGIQELRLRKGQPPWVCNGGRCFRLGDRVVQRADLDHCINMVSRYSPWTAQSLSQGYLTAPGGHRIGICGQVLLENGMPTGFTELHSLCIRIARDIQNIANDLVKKGGSLLLIGPPGSGKTTLLRDLIRQKAMRGANVSVLDQRCELFPQGNFIGETSVDVFWNCPKTQAFEIALRVMRPDYIAVDEITGIYDAQTLLEAGGCGVELLATAHASCLEDLHRRPIYRSLLDRKLFHWIVILQQDKSFRTERVSA